jgi:hypothetical protein
VEESLGRGPVKHIHGSGERAGVAAAAGTLTPPPLVKAERFAVPLVAMGLLRRDGTIIE